jgi:hypothetical protein
MIATHSIEKVIFQNGQFSLTVDGKTITLPIQKVSKKLAEASDIQRNLYTISPSGYGIHWPLLDEDLSIDSLLRMTS